MGQLRFALLYFDEDDVLKTSLEEVAFDFL